MSAAPQTTAYASIAALLAHFHAFESAREMIAHAMISG